MCHRRIWQPAAFEICNRSLSVSPCISIRNFSVYTTDKRSFQKLRTPVPPTPGPSTVARHRWSRRAPSRGARSSSRSGAPRSSRGARRGGSSDAAAPARGGPHAPCLRPSMPALARIERRDFVDLCGSQNNASLCFLRPQKLEQVGDILPGK